MIPDADEAIELASAHHPLFLKGLEEHIAARLLICPRWIEESRATLAAATTAAGGDGATVQHLGEGRFDVPPEVLVVTQDGTGTWRTMAAAALRADWEVEGEIATLEGGDLARAAGRLAAQNQYVLRITPAGRMRAVFAGLKQAVITYLNQGSLPEGFTPPAEGAWLRLRMLDLAELRVVDARAGEAPDRPTKLGQDAASEAWRVWQLRREEGLCAFGLIGGQIARTELPRDAFLDRLRRELGAQTANVIWREAAHHIARLCTLTEPAKKGCAAPSGG